MLWRVYPQGTGAGDAELEVFGVNFILGDFTVFKLSMASTRALRVDTPEQSKAMLLGVLDNQGGAPRDIVILNAGAALYAANVATSMMQGIDLARAALASGAAKARLQQLIRATQALATPLH